MRRKPDLDREIALELGVPLPTVRKVTKAFVDGMTRALMHDGAMDIHGFATLRVKLLRGGAGCAIPQYADGKLDKICVSFSKKPTLKRVLSMHYHGRKSPMEKYGVDESQNTPDSLEKHSAKKGKCPKCGADCDMHGDVVICPNCGSEPFEEKK